MRNDLPPLAWLDQHEGFATLGSAEREAIHGFSLVWSLFEAKLLKNEGRVATIVEAVDQLFAAGRVHPEATTEALAYWRGRYWTVDGATDHFEDLRFRANDRRDLVETVLSGAESGDGEVLKALLIIVYRLRNNLFHGFKWAYHFYDQRTNFELASQVLMATIEMHRPLRSH